LRQISQLLDTSRELRMRVYSAVKVSGETVIRRETPTDNAVTAAIKAANALGNKVYVVLDYQGGVTYVAQKHERA
jgi:hypothetical protein